MLEIQTDKTDPDLISFHLKNLSTKITERPERHLRCADIEGGGGPPRVFEKLNIADITGEKNSYFSYCALPQLYVKVGPRPLEKFSGSAPDVVLF